MKLRASAKTERKIKKVAEALHSASYKFIEQADDVLMRYEPWNCESWWRALAQAAIDECENRAGAPG